MQPLTAEVFRPVEPAPPAPDGTGRLILSAVAYAVSAAAGIALAYILVSWLVPGATLPQLW